MLRCAPGLPLLDAAAMRRLEAAAIAAGTPAALLMERAGAAAAVAIRRFVAPRPVLMLCGPGNNGGDGYVVARHLQAAGWPVTVAASGPAVNGPAAAMAALWAGPVGTLANARPAPLVVDALFGTGLSRQLSPPVQAALDRLAPDAGVVALDIPSGIDADTGAALGRPPACVMTIAFGAAKCGHGLGAGAVASGRLVVADIGLGPLDSETRLVRPPLRLALPRDTHKYARGHALVIEGASAGAARLAALAALRIGAGLVTLIGDNPTMPADAVMRRDDRAGRALLTDRRTRAIVLGPGLAPDSARAEDWLHAALASGIPAVFDGGALTAFGGRARMLKAAAGPLVLTPHDGEFARLFRVDSTSADRIAATRAAAVLTGAVVVRKGPSTIIAAPDGRAGINTHGAPSLATAGSGDVLAGLIGGLLAQGVDGFDAACAGAWLHGDLGRRGDPGLIADDLPALIPMALRELAPAP